MKSQNSRKDWSRRTFLRTFSASVPTLTIVLNEAGGGMVPVPGRAVPPGPPSKFTSIDLSRFFNCSSRAFGPREGAKNLGGEAARDSLLRVAGGGQVFLGIPFSLGPEGVEKQSWAVLSTRANSWSARAIEVPLQGKASFVCLASFCDWDENETPPPNEDVTEKVGQHLADAVLVYADGSEHVFPIRRRFEVNAPTYSWGHLSYASLAHRQDSPAKLTDPLSDAMAWGELQTVVRENAYAGGPLGTLWVCALANPQPERTLKALRLRAASDDVLAICGLTLYHGRENPLRYERLTLYRLSLPTNAAEERERWKVEVDLGLVARTYVLGDFDANAWLSAPAKGLGERSKPAQGARYLYAEITASPDAMLTLVDAKTGGRYRFTLGQVVPGKELEANPASAPSADAPNTARVEVLEHDKVWLRGKVVDAASGRPTPVRLAFRSKEGRYIPPYGHRTEINDGWFEDYGADVKLMDTSFAYIDGTFTAELPVGEVYVELTKGFEYLPVRKKLAIEPGQCELKLEVSRFADLREQGWIAADTHVHFLSPSTAILEGQAEG